MIGIWHGANWTFAIYGLIHAFYMIINHLWRRQNLFEEIENTILVKVIYWLITFTAVVFSMVIFRSENISDAITIYQGMLGMNGIEILSPNLKLLIVITFSMFLILGTKSTFEIVNSFFDKEKLKNINYKNLINKKIKFYSTLSGILLFLCLLQLNTPSTFLYYQF